MKAKIDEALRVLVGLPLWGGHRGGTMQVLKFGTRYPAGPPRLDGRGVPVETGDYHLHLQCPWRIADADHVVVGSGDLWEPPEETDGATPDDFDWEAPDGNRRDVRLRAYLDTKPSPVVTEIEGDGIGSLRVRFDDGNVLELFPSRSLTGESSEHWRMVPQAEGTSQFVVCGYGIEGVDTADSPA